MVEPVATPNDRASPLSRLVHLAFGGVTVAFALVSPAAVGMLFRPVGQPIVIAMGSILIVLAVLARPPRELRGFDSLVGTIFALFLADMWLGFWCRDCIGPDDRWTATLLVTLMLGLCAAGLAVDRRRSPDHG